MSWVWVHGSDSHLLAPNDRAALYGDALFETLLWTGSQLALSEFHWLRLMEGATRLKIPLEESVLTQFVDDIQKKLLQQNAEERNVVRVSVHRSVAARGYAFDVQKTPQLICSVSVAPELPSRPLALGVSQVLLAKQPLLAGMKHCNRLEQVMAAQELAERGYDDGVMCLDDGRVICTTRANIYALLNGVWYTPIISDAGVAGTRRAWLFRHAKAVNMRVEERLLTLEELLVSEAVMISNAVRGFQQVGCIEGHTIRASSMFDEITRYYASALAGSA